MRRFRISAILLGFLAPAAWLLWRSRVPERAPKPSASIPAPPSVEVGGEAPAAPLAGSPPDSSREVQPRPSAESDVSLTILTVDGGPRPTCRGFIATPAGMRSFELLAVDRESTVRLKCPPGHAVVYAYPGSTAGYSYTAADVHIRPIEDRVRVVLNRARNLKGRVLGARSSPS